jgi:hypothetical protein
MQPAQYGQLTKRFLFSLQTGQYIVSNVYELLDGGRFKPAFRESVAQPDARNEQWKRIKSAYADGRQCAVLASESDYEEFDKSLPPKRL